MITTLPTTTGVSFQVDAVEPTTETFSSTPARDAIVRGMGRKQPAKDGTSMTLLSEEPQDPFRVLSMSPCPALLDKSERTGHPILHAVHYAFDHHLPLTFGPDLFWQAILQGVSQHVAQAPEAYRRQFVAFEGKRELTLLRTDLSLSDLDAIGRATESIVDGFVGQLADHVTPAYLRVFDGAFSTTSRAEAVAAKVTCMEAFAPFFGYHMYCGCGFPRITLTGTPDDYRRLRAKVIEIEELFWLDAETNLTWWTSKLRVIVDQLIAAAEGAPDIAWWKRMYKQVDVYLNHRFNGWIGWLWPYTKVGDRYTPETGWVKPAHPWQRNPMLEDISDVITVCSGGRFSWGTPIDTQGNPLPNPEVRKTVTLSDENQRKGHAGMSETLSGSCFMFTSDFPLGLSKVDLRITDLLAGSLNTTLIGGFLGVSQDETDHGLTPQIGYALLA